MLTNIARVCLLLVVLIYFLVGQYLAFDPQRLGAYGYAFPNAENITAVRTWGGFFFATGLIGCFGVFSRKWTLPALVVISIVSGCVVAFRLFGIAVDGVEPRQLSELRDESTGLAIAITGLVCGWLGARQQSATETNPHAE